MGDINELLKKLNKTFGAGKIVRASEAKALVITRIPTGSMGIDMALGGGIPDNRITLIVGPFSSGKTMLALKIAASAQRMFAKAAERTGHKKFVTWIDAEGVFEANWAKKMGVDTNELILVRPEYGEQGLDIADVIVRSGDCGLVVLDSIAALAPKIETEESMEKQQMGVAARMVNKFLRKISAAMNSGSMVDADKAAPAIVLINQEREKVGIAYGNPTTHPGGKGQDFYNSVLLEVRRGDWVVATYKKNDEEVKETVGQWVTVRVSKNKTAPPLRKAQVKFFFSDIGVFKAGDFDTVDEVVRYGIYFGLIGKKGTYYYPEEGAGVQGKEKLVEYLRGKPELCASIREKVEDIMCRGLGQDTPVDKEEEESITGGQDDLPEPADTEGYAE